MNNTPGERQPNEQPLFSISAWSLLLVPVLILLPILIWRLDLPFISYTFGPRYGVFEIFIFTATLALVLVAAVDVRRRSGYGFYKLLPTIVFTLAGLYFVSQTAEYYPKSSDWYIREHAAQAIVGGGSPYDVEWYLYPPLPAEALAFVYQSVSAGASLLHIPADAEFLWEGVFYIYQTSQFFLIMAAFLLCFRFMQALGVKDSTIAIILLLLFMFNMPLIRTLRNHQINLWLLNAILVALIWYRRSPLLTGLSLALGGHIKLYPAALILPLVLMRQFRAFAWFVVCATALVLLQTGWNMDFKIWREFVGLLSAFPGGTAFRDNGLHSLLYNIIRMGGSLFRVGEESLQPIVTIVVWMAGVVVLGWFADRYIKRERSFREAIAAGDNNWFRESRSLGHLLDAIPLILIISPIAWEHHYILALPFALWCIVMQGKHRPWQIGIATFLIFAIPTFDVFPLSYHRLAGLCMLVWFTPPVVSQPPRFDLEQDLAS